MNTQYKVMTADLAGIVRHLVLNTGPTSGVPETLAAPTFCLPLFVPPADRKFRCRIMLHGTK